MPRSHHESHHSAQTGWLRAAVLGANDGLVSTASLVAGVAASGAGHGSILVTAMAGLVSGAMSMASGEFVSVHTQFDSERADLARERRELEREPVAEHRELASIYVGRGLEPALADQVAQQLMAHDALGAHARDELGISATKHPRPVQAALASATSFSVGAGVPLAVAALVPAHELLVWIAVSAIVFLGLLGALGAYVGGAKWVPGALRTTFWGALAMLTTAGAGALFGAVA